MTPGCQRGTSPPRARASRVHRARAATRTRRAYGHLAVHPKPDHRAHQRPARARRAPRDRAPGGPAERDQLSQQLPRRRLRRVQVPAHRWVGEGAHRDGLPALPGGDRPGVHPRLPERPALRRAHQVDLTSRAARAVDGHGSRRRASPTTSPACRCSSTRRSRTARGSSRALTLDGVTRCYSFATPRRDDGAVSFFVRKVPGGRFIALRARPRPRGP
jgi:hypothetical protein